MSNWGLSSVYYSVLPRISESQGKPVTSLFRPKFARPHSATTFKVIMERPVDADRTRGPMPCLTSDAAFQVGNQPCRVRRVTPYSRLHPDRQFTAKPLRCHAHSSAQRVSRQRFRSLAQGRRLRRCSEYVRCCGGQRTRPAHRGHSRSWSKLPCGIKCRSRATQRVSRVQKS